MKKGVDITSAELRQYIKHLRTVFDIVRVVDPYAAQVLDDSFKNGNPGNVCYKVWNKNFRCSNCISLKAHVGFERRIKYEFQKDNAFFVMAMPFRLLDEDNRIVVVEMVNEVSQEIQVQAVGSEIVTKTMHEFDRKLYTDSLTGVYSRRYFDENMFLYETRQALSKNVGFILWDIVNFKKTNDTYGHMGGDLLLKAIAEVMLRYTKAEEAVMRIGGDEFLIVMQGCKEKYLQDVIDRIKKKVQEIRIPEMEEYIPEINAGYSFTDSFDATGDMVREMLQIADERMYEDKQRTRRRLEGGGLLSAQEKDPADEIR